MKKPAKKKQKYKETYYFRYPEANQKEFGLPWGFSITTEQIRAGVKPPWHNGMPVNAWTLADKVWRRSTTGKMYVHDDHINPKNKKYDEEEFLLFKLGIVVL